MSAVTGNPDIKELCVRSVRVLRATMSGRYTGTFVVVRMLLATRRARRSR